MSHLYTLHEHQVRAVEHLHKNPRAGLLLTMGAGKSLSVLAALTPDHLPALVVAPKRVAEHVWSSEPVKWRPDLSLALALGSPERRLAAIQAGSDITVVSRDNLPGLAGLGLRQRPKYKTVILDESQSFKTMGTARWRAARKLTRTADYVWAMTGTPAGNGLMDLWGQVYLIDSGKRLGETFGGFQQRYFYPKTVLPNGVVARWELKDGAEDSIYAKIADICLHIPTVDLDLPELVINEVAITMPGPARRMYEELKKERVLDLDMLGGADMMTAESAGVLSSKLSQITAGALYGETQPDGSQGELHPLHTAKLDELDEIVQQSAGGVLVFYRFRFEQDMILKRFPDAVKISTKGAIDAWNRGEIPVLVAHPASAGHGLNLQYGGNTAVWTSVSWSSEEWLQGNARLHRQGQKNVVISHVLGVPKTIDDQVLKVVRGKVTVQEALLEALS